MTNTDAKQTENFIDIVTSRRSVRVFEKSPIPESVMQSCLDLALLAPNSSNLQPWEFYWVRSPEKKTQLIHACLSQPAAASAAELVVCIARTNTWSQNAKKMLALFESLEPHIPKVALDYYRKDVPYAHTLGPLCLFGFLKRFLWFFQTRFKPTAQLPSSSAEMILWATKSCALAAENLMLALRAYSFDSCAMEGYDPRMIKSLLKLPHGCHIVMVIAAGKRAPHGVYGPQIRFDRHHFIKEV